MNNPTTQLIFNFNSKQFKFRHLNAHFVTSSQRLVCPPSWRPPLFSLKEAQKLGSLYFGSPNPRKSPLPKTNPEGRPLLAFPSCHNKNALTGHLGPRWWHPHTDVAFCQNHIDHVTKSWFFTNWKLLDYYFTLYNIGLSHLLPQDKP